ncbi:RNA polymerase II subunit 5-mediating protein homolog [Salvia splendens]|uniref:RNA polymerase II subunit 5-mediating protein homolog n=1 Tax=Salvia splendens TaxID=180675 RepID=UPI001C27B52F|nr:RNA polymerase II subunit 5-mediating protein homolog [Salvia splendens]XP_041989860.1 RNA polymerase II subunit 5-mediating protein homolog [Salvia splendens]
MAKKGTVMQLSSVFPEEEVQKASMRVQDTITQRRRELEKLRSFKDDNTSLINLVRKLPDETHHDIMVPFGQAAFFPGRMTNPNKFLVLLGEGYHAERSAKQTVEILKRRGEAIESQIESVNAIMEDLKLEASFFDKTAHESAEGVVEIREDYIEDEGAPSGAAPTSGNKSSVSAPPVKVDNGEGAVEDEEYARILARMAELEKEEEEAEEANGSDEDEKLQNEQDNALRRDSSDRTNQEVRSILPSTREAPLVSKGGASHGDPPARNNAVVNKDSELPQKEKKILSPFPASNTAFTGSIIEHAHNIGGNAPQQQGSARSSKPLSRFKMQRK